MSLIFKALQRSRRQDPGALQAQADPVGRKNVFTWRNVLLSPSVALLVAVSIFLFGVFAAQWVKFVSLRKAQLTPHAQAAVPATHPVSPAHAVVDSPNTLEPSTRPADYSGPVQLPFQAPDQNDGQFQFFPAGHAPAGPSVAAPFPADGASQKPDGRTMAVYHPVSVSGSDDAPAGKEATANALAGESQGRGIRALVGNPGVPEGASLSRSGPMPKIASGKMPKGEPDAVHNRQARQAKQHLQVANLADRLCSAIQAGDADRSTVLLGQLQKIKGENNPFVQKLAAYLCIRQGDLGQARELLTSVLASQPDDLGAGLNMAVVDIQGGRHDQARHRLERLLHRYPEEDKIIRYLNILRH